MKSLLMYMLLALIGHLPQVLLAQNIHLPVGEDGFYNQINHQLSVKNYNSAIYRVEKRVTVFNKNAAELARAYVDESKLIKCRKISVVIYDLAGKELEKSEKDDIKKSTFSGGQALYDDTRYQAIDLRYHRYPYQAHVITEVELKTLFLWPSWMPQKNYPVMESTYELIIPDQVTYRTHMTGMDIRPSISRRGSRSAYVWSLRDLASRESEEHVAPEHKQNMILRFAPGRFQLGNYRGDMSSWNSFAIWYRSMLQGLMELPPEAEAAVNDFVNRQSDKKKLVAELYRYLQQQTRYVAIYLDIGGWQPHKAEEVFLNKYGDCKDLSLFMVAMLDKAGIKAYPALALTRDQGMVIPEFPSNQFNHCIAVVPLENDTLWLECTADYLAADEIPSSLEGTNVLLIKENGGELIRVPSSHADQNFWHGSAHGKLTPKGGLQVSGTVMAGGEQGKWLRSSNYAQDDKDQRAWLKSVVGRNVSQLDFETYDLINMRDNLSEPATIKFNGTVANFANKSARRIFLNPNIFNRISARSLPEDSIEERKFPIYGRYPYADLDTVRIDLPPGFVIEAAPEAQTVETSFGRFQTAYQIVEDQFVYTRNFAIYQSLIAVEKYQEYLDFMTTVAKSDESKFVLKRR